MKLLIYLMNYFTRTIHCYFIKWVGLATILIKTKNCYDLIIFKLNFVMVVRFE